MIGPHEGKELELMLQGKKPLALFSGLPEENSREDIFPEQKFLPYVTDGTFQRLCVDIPVLKNGSIVRYVLFFPPQEGWRAKTIVWLNQETLGGQRKFDVHDDILIGRLLGYTEVDIESFIHHQASISKLCQHNTDKDCP